MIFQGSCKVLMQYVLVLLFFEGEGSTSVGLDSREACMGERFPLIGNTKQNGKQKDSVCMGVA